MYLREMGSVELLSREGEIAIAKRIEAGRETMIAGLCESPLTFQAIIIWRDELAAGKILLRDIIDLEATYAGPDAKNAPIQVHTPPEGGHQQGRGNPYIKIQPANPPPPLAAGDEDDEVAQERARIAAQEEEDEDDFENAMSLAAMEAELKPKVVETFDKVADEYKKLRRLQDQDVEFKLKNTTLSPSQERRYKKLKDEIVTAVKSLSLNQHRIDTLVEQLYDINKRLIGYEGRLLRLAESYRVNREDFLKEYQGAELDPNWIRRISNLGRAAGRNSSPRRRSASRTSAATSRTSPPRPASRSSSTAASSTWCRRASARRARRRRRWSRRTSAWSSRSPRNTPTAACSSST